MWLASCSKLVTTVAALQCVERGLFDLNSIADVERLLPEWNNAQLLTGFAEDGQALLQLAKEKTTLARLLTHTSGMTYDFFPALIPWRASRGEPLIVMDGPLTEVFQLPLVCEPGEGFAYGAGLDLVGLMVARANSCTLEEYFRKHIFSVLGMNDTSFYPKTIDNLSERLMQMTSRPSPDGPLIHGSDPGSALSHMPLDPKDEFGGAGLFGTAADFLKLLKSIQRDDGQLLKSETIDLMFQPSISTSSTAALRDTLSIDAYATIMAPGEPLVGTPGGGEWSHGLGGLLGLTEKEDGSGLKAPWMQWGGAPNLKWWIDRKGGSCGIFATQLLPAGEKKHQVLWTLFQNEMARKFAKKQV
jgi:CubicO group peptidase (beta-lactamase class C family)